LLRRLSTALVEIFDSAVFPRYFGIALLGAVAAGAGACGPDGPSPYYFYPPGPCASDLECPYGTNCIDPGPGMCLAPCRSNLDCGPAYACESKKRRGTPGKVSICAIP
jgi:hypothetical protein